MNCKKHHGVCSTIEILKLNWGTAVGPYALRTSLATSRRHEHIIGNLVNLVKQSVTIAPSTSHSVNTFDAAPDALKAPRLSRAAQDV